MQLIAFYMELEEQYFSSEPAVSTEGKTSLTRNILLKYESLYKYTEFQLRNNGNKSTHSNMMLPSSQSTNVAAVRVTLTILEGQDVYAGTICQCQLYILLSKDL